ncbi:MAG: hypothetical protein Ct9H300mP19_00680 [Dehalococcoidia bacterium]|nr:MAG: hypothetical protein Ct9H300mP19_00680 [Dehalococcoidia bacterium]
MEWRLDRSRKALMDAYVDFVDFDWVGQYLKRLED